MSINLSLTDKEAEFLEFIFYYSLNEHVCYQDENGNVTDNTDEPDISYSVEKSKLFYSIIEKFKTQQQKNDRKKERHIIEPEDGIVSVVDGNGKEIKSFVANDRHDIGRVRRLAQAYIERT